MDWTRRLRLKHLELLISLAETQNISRSAERLNMTQPAVSKWLRELEEDLGLLLFERHARGLRPTAEGHALIHYAVRINTDLSRAREEMDALRKGSSGRVVIGASGAAIASVVPKTVSRLLDEMPSVDVQIVEGPMERLIQQLSRRELDFAVGYFVAPFDDPAIKSEILYRERMHFVVRWDHPLAQAETVDWADLMRFRWVIWSRGIPAREVFATGLVAAGRSPPPGSVLCNSMLASIALVTGTDMIVAISNRALDLPESARIMRRLPVPLDAYGDVAVYWRNDSSDARSRQVLLRTLRGVASEGGQHRSEAGAPA